MDAEEHFKCLNDRQKCSIIDLQCQIGRLKNEKVRQNKEVEKLNEEIEKQTWKNRDYFGEIVRLSKLKDDMKEEIETLKKQITEKEAEIRQHECSQSNKGAVEPLFDRTEGNGQKDSRQCTVARLI